MRRRPTRTVAGIAIFVLGACSGETTTSAGSAEAETLADFFGGGLQSPEEMEARFAEDQRRIQDLVAACMADAGFEYTPFVPPTPDFSGGLELSSEDPVEVARARGFGITAQIEELASAETVTAEPWEDPNQERLAAMSPSEQEAYNEALWGPPDAGEPQVDPETGETFYVVEGFGGGCMGQAQEEVFGSQQPPPELEDDMAAMYESITSDPRVVAAEEEWSACMADHGYEIASLEGLTELVDELWKRFDALAAPTYVDPLAGMSPEEAEQFVAERTPEELEAFAAEARRQALEAIDEEALAALRDDEINLAVANAECRLPLDDAYAEVGAEKEAEFIRTHREELEALRDDRG